jgi:hypothetical protein
MNCLPRFLVCESLRLKNYFRGSYMEETLGNTGLQGAPCCKRLTNPKPYAQILVPAYNTTITYEHSSPTPGFRIFNQLESRDKP